MILESENTEFKAKLTDEIYKEVIAFANTDGGVIYIGVDDNGNVVGIDNVDDTYTRITNGIRDAIQPDVTMFVKYKLEDNRVVKITVGEGSYKPYYLKSKGLKPNGVYIRQGASSVQASSEQIRRMIKVSDAVSGAGAYLFAGRAGISEVSCAVFGRKIQCTRDQEHCRQPVYKSCTHSFRPMHTYHKGSCF